MNEVFMKKEYNLKKMKEVKNPYKAKVKKGVHINLSHEAIDYFKNLSLENDIPYQKLIDMYLLDCAKKKKKIKIQWAG